MRAIFNTHAGHRVRLPFPAVLLLLCAALLLPGCEDDPILEPTGDESGGGSYGIMSPLSAKQPAESRESNPEIF